MSILKFQRCKNKIEYIILTETNSGHKEQFEKHRQKLVQRIEEFLNKHFAHTLREKIDIDYIIAAIKHSPFIKKYPFHENVDLDMVSELEAIIDSIMDFYTLLVICHTIKKVNIVYLGLFHSARICYYLKQFYNFKVVEEFGITEKNIKDVDLTITNLKTKSCTI